MDNFDPLVANGITYAPIKDIVMSDAPVYGTQAYTGQQKPIPPTNVLKNEKDVFVPQKKESSSWWKWALGIGGTIGAFIGLKKGVKELKNANWFKTQMTNHPKIKSFLSSIKNHIPFVKKW